MAPYPLLTLYRTPHDVHTSQSPAESPPAHPTQSFAFSPAVQLSSYDCRLRLTHSNHISNACRSHLAASALVLSPRSLPASLPRRRPPCSPLGQSIASCAARTAPKACVYSVSVSTATPPPLCLAPSSPSVSPPSTVDAWLPSERTGAHAAAATDKAPTLTDSAGVSSRVEVRADVGRSTMLLRPMLSLLLESSITAIALD
eukprot:scaffold22164_cov68-Phaeocystis_antarctica.AAC.1